MSVIPPARAATTAIHGGRRPDPTSRALVTPIVQSTTYTQARIGAVQEHAYSRVSNPTVTELERQLGALEDTPPAVCFATGLAAETAAFLALLKAGDHAVLGDAIYGGTVRLFNQLLNGLGISATFVDSTDAENVRRAITARTKLVFIETPANPTLTLTDIAAVARHTKAAGVPLIVDNTFLTPVIQRPLDLGADACVYSTTKHIDGHSLALGGAVTTRDPALLDRLRFIRKSTGNIQAPFQAWLTGNGLKTLPLRLRQHSHNALAVASWLRRHPAVARVNYPGLPDHPQAELAARQHGELHGGVLSFELVGGTSTALDFLHRVKLAVLVEHVGSVETLVTHSATMTHADVPREHREKVGITDGLVRLSVGIEDVRDIIADLDQALEHAVEATVEQSAAGTVRAVAPRTQQEGAALCQTR